MRFLKSALLALVILVPQQSFSQSGGRQLDGAPLVVVDIAPVQSLVAQVMQGVAEPVLLVRPGASPHHYTLTPSKARALSQADLVVWIGPELTPWLRGAVGKLAGPDRALALLALEGTRRLPTRTDFAALSEPAQEKPRPVPGGDGGHDHTAHTHGPIDPHAWLAPENAVIWVRELAGTLARIDPEHSDIYRKNADALVEDLQDLQMRLRAQIAAAKPGAFIVLHDAFQYLEVAFDLQALGALSQGDAMAPGAARVRAMKQLIAEKDVVCAFSEPQLNDRILRRLSEATQIKLAVLDLLGAGIAAGTKEAGQVAADAPRLYQTMMQALITSIADCFNA